MRIKKFLFATSLVVLSAVTITSTYADDELEARAVLGGTPFAIANYGNNVVKGSVKMSSQNQGRSTKVVVKLTGLTPGTGHIGHIHGGNCPQLFVGTILHNLEPVVADAAGAGVSRTLIPESLQGLVDCSWWVAIHEGPQNTVPRSPAIAVGAVITGDDQD